MQARVTEALLVRAGVVITAVGIGAAVVAAPASAGPVVDTPPPVAWTTCADEVGLPPVPDAYGCASYDVPLDHADPDGATIELGLIRRPADDPDNRLGSLFVNFGGPGGPAVDTVALAGEVLFAPEVLARYDLVGMDPRGIGRSTPLVCVGPDDDPYAYFPAWFWPESAREIRQTRLLNQALDAKCVEDGGPIREHMSTTAVADDLEILRQAVGDEQLAYVGFSYGTYLGAVYANRYPDRVGPFLLDAVVDPVAWATGRPGQDPERLPTFARVGSDRGAQDTLQEFVRLCEEAGPDGCAFAPDPEARFAALVDALDREPIAIPELGTAFDDQLLLYSVANSLYDSTAWELIATELLLLEQLAAGELPPTAPEAGPALARVAGVLQPSVITPEQQKSVICSDSLHPDRISAWTWAERQSTGYFTPYWTWIDLQCSDWSAIDVDRYLGPFEAQTATPVLLSSTTFDPATPIQGARALRADLPGSRLLTVEGWGHTTLGLSACATAVQTDYLLTGEVPAQDVTCQQDVTPFSAAPAGLRLQADPAAEARSVVLDALRATTGGR